MSETKETLPASEGSLRGAAQNLATLSPTEKKVIYIAISVIGFVGAGAISAALWVGSQFTSLNKLVHDNAGMETRVKSLEGIESRIEKSVKISVDAMNDLVKDVRKDMRATEAKSDELVKEIRASAAKTSEEAMALKKELALQHSAYDMLHRLDAEKCQPNGGETLQALKLSGLLQRLDEIQPNLRARILEHHINLLIFHGEFDSVKKVDVDRLDNLLTNEPANSCNQAYFAVSNGYLVLGEIGLARKKAHRYAFKTGKIVPSIAELGFAHLILIEMIDQKGKTSKERFERAWAALSEHEEEYHADNGKLVSTKGIKESLEITKERKLFRHVIQAEASAVKGAIDLALDKLTKYTFATVTEHQLINGMDVTRERVVEVPARKSGQSSIDSRSEQKAALNCCGQILN